MKYMTSFSYPMKAYSLPYLMAVYHVTEDGWKKVRGDDVTELHFQYYPKPELHPSNASVVI